jgi:predicted O-methyltransferase YrrM
MDDEQLSFLPRHASSRYWLPIDYPPSRDYRARYGGTQPPIPSLMRWFEDHSEQYRGLLERMRFYAPALADVPFEYGDGSGLPLPAWTGAAYAPFDGLALHTLIRDSKPKRFLEIGSGITTCFAHHAIKAAGLETKIISIDPQPRASIDSICDTVIRSALETSDLSMFDELEAGDILFFDGSHRSFMNSDVTVFFIDILPRLKPGVLVHVHDITLPWDYPEMFFNWYWNEQYMLAVYLMNAKDRLVPTFPTHFVCRQPEFRDLREPAFLDFGDKNYFWDGGGAMWFTIAS